MAKTIPKTKSRIIAETVAYYLANPARRAVEKSTCMYLTSDNRKCAVGRCMIRPRMDMVGTAIGFRCTALGINVDDGIPDKLFKPAYRGHETDFWRDLQRLHDSRDYWENEGMNRNGYDYLAKLYKDWVK